MSDDKYEIIKRVFLAQPRVKKYKTQWTVRPVDNLDIAESHELIVPVIKGWGHEKFELYYHESVVNDLRDEVKSLKDEVKRLRYTEPQL